MLTFTPNHTPTAAVIAPPPRISAARYLLSGPTRLRSLTCALPIAEICRAALMAIYGSRFQLADGRRGRSEILAGKTADGAPLQGHVHTYFLPTDEDADGFLDHLTLFAAGGFDTAHQAAMTGLTRLCFPNNADFLRVDLIGLGIADQMAVGPLGNSHIWESATPYLATRFARPKGGGAKIDFAEFLLTDLVGQLALFSARCGVETKAVGAARLAAPTDRNTAARPGPRDFTRSRLRREDNGGLRACGYFRIEFQTPVPGPVALGHNAHFGMGLFLPARKRNPPYGSESTAVARQSFCTKMDAGPLPLPEGRHYA